MEQMKRRERYEAEQWAKMQQRIPVMMEFRYDSKLRPGVLPFARVDAPSPFLACSDDLEFAIRTRRGNVEPMFCEEQLSKLRTPKRPTPNTERRI